MDDPTNPLAQVQAMMKGELDPARERYSSALGALGQAYSAPSEEADEAGRWGAIASGFAQPATNFGQALAQAGGAYGKELQRQFQAQQTRQQKRSELEFTDAAKRLQMLEGKYMGALTGTNRAGLTTSPVRRLNAHQLFDARTGKTIDIPATDQEQAKIIQAQTMKQAMLLDPTNAAQYTEDYMNWWWSQRLAGGAQPTGAQFGVPSGAAAIGSKFDLVTPEETPLAGKYALNMRGATKQDIDTALSQMPEDVRKQAEALIVPSAGVVKPTIEDKRAETAGAKAKATAEFKVLHGIAGLSDEQKQVLNTAMLEGRVDPNRVNSKTAVLLADALLQDPKADLTKLSADIALARNPGFRLKAIVADTLPEVLNSMVNLGKKIGYSDIKTVGKMQAWVKGELNDPDYTEYMALRNDALMEIAGVMRGTGMTDQAHRAEMEAASPTMSPQALDAWLRAQMTALKPRLDRYRRITKDPELGKGEHATPAKEEGPAEVWERDPVTKKLRKVK